MVVEQVKSTSEEKRRWWVNCMNKDISVCWLYYHCILDVTWLGDWLNSSIEGCVTFWRPFCSQQLTHRRQKIGGPTPFFLFHFTQPSFFFSTHFQKYFFFKVRCKITKKIYQELNPARNIHDILPSQIYVTCVTPCRQPKLSGGLLLWNTCKGCSRQSWSRFCSSKVCRSLLVQLCYIAAEMIARQGHIWKYSIEFASSIVSNRAAKLKEYG